MNHWTTYICEQCKHPTKHPSVVRSIPRCKECGGPTVREDIKKLVDDK